MIEKRIQLPIVFLITLLLSFRSGNAQQQVVDSFRNEISKYHERDSLRVKAIVSYVVEALNGNTTDFLPYLTEVISISKDIGYKRGLQKGYMIGQIYYSDRGEYEQAFLYADSAFRSLADDPSTNARVNLGHLHNNVAGDFFKLGDSEKAMENLTASARIFEPMDHPFLAVVYSTMAEVYEKNNESDKAVELDKKALAIAEKNQDPARLAVRLLNFAMRRINRKEFSEAAELIKRAEPIVIKLENTSILWLFHYNSAYVEEDRKNYVAALSHYKKALDYANQNEDVYQKLNVMEAMSDCLITMNNLSEAKLYVDSLLLLSTKHDMKRSRYNGYINLASWYEKKKDYPETITYLRKASTLYDSLVSEESKTKIGAMEVRYNVEKKEQEIKTLKAESEIQNLALRQKNIINWVLVGSTVMLVIILALAYRTYQQKQKFQQRRISELETEKQLSATAAVLKGEEQERTRLAKDLHDGLGGMLSGIKYSLNTMKENQIMTPENAQAFERSIDMLDSSIKEMRRVAHNMMPESLVKFGLDTALKDFCNDINQSGALSVNYQSIGLNEGTMGQTTAITIYRIVQELLHNTIKHAGARTAIVQVTKLNKEVSVTVEDDGKGFNTSILTQSKGIGWTNIQHRVDFLKGKVDVDSQAGKGTSIHIEFTI